MKTLNLIRAITTGGMISISVNSFSKLPAPAIMEIPVTYTAGETTLKGYVAYDDNIKGKRPAVVVVHEWWGVNDNMRTTVKQLAELGYIAITADIFGDGKVATNPTEAQNLTSPFYSNSYLAKARLDAAIKKIKEYPQTDPGNVAAVGYCFGGYVVLNSAMMGSDLRGAVSIHGGLTGVKVNKGQLKAKFLICQGGDDKFVPESAVKSFTHKLDSIGAVYTLKMYPGAGHAYSNPGSTKLGKQFNIPIAYNEAAATGSWNEMKTFLGKVFGK
jgi:dienelactone hydrolase